ncbi:MSMEG_0570 family nitrogen starvation response protein [Maribius pontilimi]|uniref:MSMEG_0570 family nitrogen starvation response protein n=1 Tax=Palleronia pontilimi TaxID=1964209 RepID=A0A934MGL7_9RHOB|nr:MSMEG_0570 family nitrogen starvation response protein [Palleronia pontilimi]MBJ3762514.1 MSMEG_0570 family nitrogen starvation response protein [Palleronia pontilimi]
MPEVDFRIRWPDGSEESCYSPSTAIRTYLSAGKTYALRDFMDRSLAGLDLAARRVEAKYGFRCTSADAQAARLTARAAAFSPEETITCLSMT